MASQSESLDRITLLLQGRGVVRARDLQDQLGVGQSRVSRLLSALGPRIVRIGARSRSRYGLRRNIRHLGNEWPIYRLNSGGRPEVWARLHALEGGYLVEWREKPAWLDSTHPDGEFAGLPFFLEELRPQGFLGRLTARALAESGGYLADPRRWSGDDVLTFLLQHGDDVPGDLVIGERMLECAQRRPLISNSAMAAADRERCYPELAERASRGDVPASSAGGEHPKFLTRLAAGNEVRSALVKFTAPTSNPGGQRWADLLLAEWHALEVLRAEGVSASRAEILDAGGRRFLEVTRFDRDGETGRRGVISLSAVEAALLEPAVSSWIGAAHALARAGLLDGEQAGLLRRLASFGELIGNSDMHLGNMGLWFGDQASFQLAPVYDMLPMLFAPTAHGELIPRDFRPPPPSPELLADWSQASHWALQFWSRVRGDRRFSSEFAAEAGRCHAVVAGLRDRFGRT
jgi:HipA-like C-terminal domain